MSHVIFIVFSFTQSLCLPTIFTDDFLKSSWFLNPVCLIIPWWGWFLFIIFLRTLRQKCHWPASTLWIEINLFFLKQLEIALVGGEKNLLHPFNFSLEYHVFSFLIYNTQYKYIILCNPVHIGICIYNWKKIIKNTYPLQYFFPDRIASSNKTKQ